MRKDITPKTKLYIKRYYVRVIAFGVFVTLVISGMYYLNARDMSNSSGSGREVSSQSSATSSHSSGLPRSNPTRIVIPKLKIDTTFVPPLGLNADKTVSVPDSNTQVGWYAGGATPGEVGPAVILGHVDSYLGPAIFYSLGQLKPGDEITITRADNKEVTFVVESLEHVSQSDFPTLKVYGPIDYPGLRLVTCSGTYLKTEKRYSNNLIVYAKIK